MQFFVTEATQEQLDQIKEAIAQSARRAMEAGVDAIEVHGDRLLGSLCSTFLNHRTDHYGGSLENRVRYPLEVVKAIKEAAPSLFVEYKLPIITINEDGTSRGKGGLYEDEGIEFAKMLEEAGVDMIQVAQANHTGNMGDTIPPMGTVPYNWTLPTCRKVKAVVNVPVLTVGRVVSLENAEEILEAGDADMIGFGRSLLADADIVHKAQRKEPIRECLNCNKGCVDAIQGRRYISCILNAENGDEGTIFIKPSEEKKHVVILGAGIAGLEAARVASLRGHQVDLYEKEDHIGGQICIAAVPPRKSEILRSIEYYEKILPRLGVDLHLNTECTKEAMNAADVVLCAIGAHDITLPFVDANDPSVVSSWDVLNQSVRPTGKVAIIGGGLVGTETAEYLVEQGADVSIIEMIDHIANGESSTILPLILEDFKQHDVKQYVNTKVDCIEEHVIYATNTESNESVEIPFDYVVMAVGSKKNTIDLDGVTTPVTYIGDCSGERTASICEAIRTAYHAANGI